MAKEIYWLLEKPTDAIKKKILKLKQQNLNIIVFREFDKLVQKFKTKRVGVIVISNEGFIKRTENAMNQMHKDPDFSGVRFILTISKAYSDIIKKALEFGFRDVITNDLPTKIWVSRFIFAISNSQIKVALPSGQLTTKELAAINVPARISWINEKKIWIETSITPPQGAKIKLTGAMVQALNLKSATMVVETIHSNNLRFRYSNALICSWESTPHIEEKKRDVIKHIQRLKTTPPYKAFVALKSIPTRNELFRRLSLLDINIYNALNRNSIINEPKFINPHVIFIDGDLCLNGNQAILKKILDDVDKRSLIYILGNDQIIKKVRALQETGINNIIPIRDFGSEFIHTLQRKLAGLRLTPVEESILYIPQDHPFSSSEINISARMTKIHPVASEFAVPFHLPEYSVCSVFTPLLKNAVKRRVLVKVIHSSTTDSSEYQDFPCKITCFLSDVNTDDRAAIGREMKNLLAQKLDLIENVEEPLEEDEPDIVQMERLLFSDNSEVADGSAGTSGSSARRRPQPIKRPTFQWSSLYIPMREIRILIFFGMLLYAIYWLLNNIEPNAVFQNNIISNQIRGRKEELEKKQKSFKGKTLRERFNSEDR